MEMLAKAGRFLYAIPMVVFGIFHFMRGGAMAGMVPIPGGVFWVYLTGAALILAALAIMVDKKADLASGGLALFLILTATTVHLPAVMGGGDAAQAAMPNMLKDIALAGGALVLMGMFGDRRSTSASSMGSDTV